MHLCALRPRPQRPLRFEITAEDVATSDCHCPVIGLGEDDETFPGSDGGRPQDAGRHRGDATRIENEGKTVGRATYASPDLRTCFSLPIWRAACGISRGHLRGGCHAADASGMRSMIRLGSACNDIENTDHRESPEKADSRKY